MTDSDQLELAIDALLEQRPMPARVDDDLGRIVRHLAELHGAPVPPGLARRASPFRSWTAPRIAVAVLGVLFLVHGFPNVFFGEALAAWLGLHYEPHTFRESGLAYLAVGLVLLAGVLRPRLMDAALIAGVPLGIVLGLGGVALLPGSPNPSAEMLHFAEAIVAIVALVTFWRAKRRERA